MFDAPSCTSSPQDTLQKILINIKKSPSALVCALGDQVKAILCSLARSPLLAKALSFVLRQLMLESLVPRGLFRDALPGGRQNSVDVRLSRRGAAGINFHERLLGLQEEQHTQAKTELFPDCYSSYLLLSVSQ